MSTPRYEPYLDARGDDFRWRLGLRPLDLDDWLQYDEHAAAELTYKRRLLTEHPDTVFVVDDGDDVLAASTEVRDAILAAVPERYRVADDSLHPLDAAGRMVQEDLVVMIEREGGLICGGGSVCFPNRWHLPDKVGKTMMEIHAPVPRLNAELGAAVDRTLSRLTPDRSFWRLGWTVLDTSDLYQPVDGSAAPSLRPAEGGGYWLRVERETLRRFPETAAVLFTIRTYLSPLAAVPGTSRRRLSAQLESMGNDIVEYKSLSDIGPVVSDWLRTHGADIASPDGRPDVPRPQHTRSQPGD